MAFLFLIATGTCSARDNDYRSQSDFRPQSFMPKVEVRREDSNYFKYTKDFVDGGIRGDFIEKPNIANIIGNLAVNLTPAYLIANVRDFSVNFTRSFESGFKEHKTATVLCAAGFIPIVTEVKTLKGLCEAGREARFVREVEMSISQFAPAMESGLTRKLQTSIVRSLEDGEVVGIRKRAYLANFLDGKLPAKPAGAMVETVYQNGVRELKNGQRVISDLDMAFVSRNGRALSETRAVQVGEKINQSYGHEVVMHGDNFSGVKKGIEKAVDISQRADDIFIFDKTGFIEAGNYQSMIDRYIRRR